MYKKIALGLMVAVLAGCGGSSTDSVVSTVDTTSWTSHDEGQFSLLVPSQFQRITASDMKADLTSGFVVGYSEVTLGNDFNTTATIHRESLEKSTPSLSYELGFRETARQMTGFKEEKYYPFTLAGEETSIQEFTFTDPVTKGPMYAIQTAITADNGITGSLISCLTKGENGSQDVCRGIVQNFSLKSTIKKTEEPAQ